ncbi:MAG: hypothetical protein FWD44_09410 [Oscillospiraceae bacterium]|nr:hypothetical protein [Oscillospiraceae bacterium]
MKISAIKVIIYGIFCVGVFVAFVAVFTPVLSDSLAIFSLIGGVIVLIGILFCIITAITPCCPYCHELLSIRKKSPEYCPHCDKELR